MASASTNNDDDQCNNNNNCCQNLQIRVTGCETREADKKFTVYKIDVTTTGPADDDTWHVYRRFQEFHDLCEKLKIDFPNYTSSLKLPRKKLFGTFNPNFLEQRRAGLDLFVQEILLANYDILHHSRVQEFLNLNCKRGDQHHRRSSPADSGYYSSGMSSCNGESNSSADSQQGMAESDSSSSSLVNLGNSERPNMKPSDFDFIKVIGKGSFGKVFLARRKEDSRLHAIKVLQKDQVKRRNEVKHIMAERNVLVKNVRHPFLVGLNFSFQTKAKLYFVLDYVNGGELYFHLQREKSFDETRVRFYGAEIASALGYLHSMDIIYRDLKPENLLLDSEGHVVLTDFGLCKEGIRREETTSTFCGTAEYLAPEVIQKQAYGKPVDWWCLGSVLYEMFFGLPPFYNRDHKTMYENILYKTLHVRNTISIQAKELLVGLLQKDPSKRLGSEGDFEQIREHPFFTTIDWTELESRTIKPPFDPGVISGLDLRNFDKDFLCQSIPGSVVNPLSMGRSISRDYDFDGFSYVPPPNQLSLSNVNDYHDAC